MLEKMTRPNLGSTIFNEMKTKLKKMKKKLRQFPPEGSYFELFIFIFLNLNVITYPEL